jgi:Lrp/AsnC family leucine-responsive transcriptional regulator
MTLDDIDLKLLQLLQSDGRLSHAALGKEIGLTGPSVYARIQHLEREQIIKGYSVLLDATKLGQGLIAIVRVGTQADLNEAQQFEDFVRSEPQILECHDVDGEDSYILKVQTATPQTLRNLLMQIRSISGITRTVTSISLLTVKETLGPVLIQ